MTTAINISKKLFIFFAGIFILSIAAAFLTDTYFIAAVPFAMLLLYLAWQNKEIAFYLLLLSLPLSVEYQFTDTLGTDIPDEFLMIFVSGIFLAYCLYSPKAFPGKALRHPIVLLLAISFCWAIVSVVFSTGPIVSLKYLLAKCWYIGAFVAVPLILFKEKKAISISAKLFTISIISIAIVSLIRHSNTSYSFASINDSIYPFFRNHVNYSAMLVCCIPILFAFLQWSTSKNQRYLVLIAISIALIALFLSYARGAWLALIIGAIAYWLIKKRWLLYSYILVVLITMCLIFWIKTNDRYLNYAHDYRTTIFHKEFGEHIIATYQLKDVSTAERFYRWIAGVRMVKDNWLTGYGPNTFYNHYKEYAVPVFKTWVSDNNDHSTVHNYYLLMAIEQGIAGLFFFIVLTGCMLYYAEYLYQRIADPFYKSVVITAGIILSMILFLNFLSDLIETDKIGSLFFLCLATLVAIDINTEKIKNSSLL